MHLSYYNFISSFLDLLFWLTWSSCRPLFCDFDLTDFDLILLARLIMPKNSCQSRSKTKQKSEKMCSKSYQFTSRFENPRFLSVNFHLQKSLEIFDASTPVSLVRCQSERIERNFSKQKNPALTLSIYPPRFLDLPPSLQ